MCLLPTLIVRPEKAREILAELATLGPDEGHPGFAVEGPRYGPLPTHRCFVTSRDAAAAFRAAALVETAPFAAYIIAARDTLGGIAAPAWIERMYGTLPPIRDQGWFDGRPAASPLYSRAAARDLGWTAQDDWPAVIRAATGG